MKGRGPNSRIRIVMGVEEAVEDTTGSLGSQIRMAVAHKGVAELRHRGAPGHHYKTDGAHGEEGDHGVGRKEGLLRRLRQQPRRRRGTAGM